MNTQTRVHRLQAGEALSLPANGAGQAILAQGEVLVQPPARWLGGTVVLSPAVRWSAPALLPLDGEASVIAAADAVVVTERVPGLVESWVAALARSRIGRRLASA